MAEAATKRYAVVTGANKGIGLEICNQLASNGITVVLTSRDEKRGIEALEKLKGYSDHIIFHQLDVADSVSVASLAEFVKAKFGKLDILVNNAGHGGSEVNHDALTALRAKHAGVEWEEVLMTQGEQIKWDEIITETYDSAQQCLQTNYYGAKRMTEALIPLLKLSDSPRIVNVSSSMGKLQKIPNEWAKGILNDVESLTEEKVEEVINEFLKDFKEGLVHAKNWPNFMSAYVVSKAVLNAYTRILAKNYPTLNISSICPGFVKTDINFNTGTLTVEQGAESAVKIALLPHGGPSGLFYYRGELTSYE